MSIVVEPAAAATAAPTHLSLVRDALDRLSPQAPPDLVVLAYRQPDPHGHQTVASFANWQTGGVAHSFALCSSGAAFDALRVVHGYLATGAIAAALLVVVDLPDEGVPSAATVSIGPGGWAVAGFGAGASDADLELEVSDTDWAAVWRDLDGWRESVAVRAAATADRVVLRPWR